MIEALRALVRRSPGLHALARRVRVAVAGAARSPLEKAIERRLRLVRGVRFLQVGSNDGRHNDPINRLVLAHRSWSGIFVEPVPYLFERLRRTYGAEERFAFENVAVAAEGGIRPFFCVSADAAARAGEELPVWHEQLGSFDRAHILKHLDGRLEPYILTLQVPCARLGELLERNRTARLDLLHIDTEGHDYAVLSQLDFGRYLPRVILFEHIHLKPGELAAADDLLARHGYRVERYGNDTLATRGRLAWAADLLGRGPRRVRDGGGRP